MCVCVFEDESSMNPYLGYDKAAAIAKNAHKKGISLRESALEHGITDAQFDDYVRPELMLGPN